MATTTKVAQHTWPKPEIKMMRLSEVRFDQTIYPRRTHDPALVQRYATVMEQIESLNRFIAVASDGTLLDGRHRHLAYQKLYEDKPDLLIKVFVYAITDEGEKLALAAELNSSHGYQLKHDDKVQTAIRLYSLYGYKQEDIALLLSVRKATVGEWLKEIIKRQRQERERRIFDLWLACHSQEEIAKAVGVSQDEVALELPVLREKFLGTGLVKHLASFTDSDWQPPLYNIWSFAKKTNEVSHFGNSEQRILENLLYLYTEPFDIVIDPFAGGGSTIDVCKNRLRRYWASDRKPIVERKDEIRQMDASTDMPALKGRWGDVALTYLDPPYWRQAQNKYSKDAEDLANMDLEKFTVTLAKLIGRYAAKQTKGAIALLMQPTQWNADGRQFTDHITDIIKAVRSKNLVLEYRVSCPYSTEQYNAQQIEWAKANKKLLVITRELIIWKVIPNVSSSTTERTAPDGGEGAE